MTARYPIYLRLLMILALAIPIGSYAVYRDPATYIPDKARDLIPTVLAEHQLYFPELTLPGYIPSLIEHESCISLTHRRCWDPRSRLKTSREEGAGLGQLTRAYRPSGGLRFDALTSLRRAHLSALRELNWGNVYRRPDLQIRAIVLMLRDNYRLFRLVRDDYQRLAFSDAAYNGGAGGVQKERRYCGLMARCDPQQWFNHVEQVCLKSHRALYGNRSACDINRHHVRDVLRTRMPKYDRYLDTLSPE